MRLRRTSMMRRAPPCTRSASHMLGGKLCANRSPYRMLPLTHGRDQRIIVRVWLLRRPAGVRLQDPELTTYARAPCAGRLWSSISRRMFQRGGFACRSGAHGSRRVFRSRDISAISRWAVFAQLPHCTCDCARLRNAQTMILGAISTRAS